LRRVGAGKGEISSEPDAKPKYSFRGDRDHDDERQRKSDQAAEQIFAEQGGNHGSSKMVGMIGIEPISRAPKARARPSSYIPKRMQYAL
jgi:hypothetical protein